MNQNQQTLAEQRLSLLEVICQAADEIKKIDEQLKENRGF
jgi:hypothetical protein